MIFELNEIFFFFQTLLAIGFVFVALRWGAGALTALIALQAVLANLFVVKQMELFGLTVTCSDVFAVGSLLGLNLLQEHFGKEAAKLAVKVSFLCLVFFFAMAQIHIWYHPTASDATHGAFAVIFSSTFRIVAASIGVYWLVQKCDVALYGWLKRKGWTFRAGLSLLATQLLDTVLFSFFGLYGLVESIFDVMVVSYVVKCLVIAFGGSLATFSKRMVKDGLSI